MGVLFYFILHFLLVFRSSIFYHVVAPSSGDIWMG